MAYEPIPGLVVSHERQVLRGLGRALTLAIEATCRNFQPGETEADVAGHLAHRLIRLYGMKPDKDVKVVFTGLREGEKVTEALVDDNEVRQPLLPGIFEVANQAHVAPLADEIMHTLYALAQEGHDEPARTMVFNLVNPLRDPAAPPLARVVNAE